MSCIWLTVDYSSMFILFVCHKLTMSSGRYDAFMYFKIFGMKNDDVE